MRYAVVLAGVPGRISNAVKESLQARYSDNHVIRAAGALLFKDGIVKYDNQLVADILRTAADAVFGKSSRPHGFCRNTNRPCAIKSSSKRNCGKTSGQACSIEQPDFLIILYHPGKNLENLTAKLHFASMLIPLPTDCYNHQNRTIEAVVELLKVATNTLGVIKRALESSKTPLLLPPLNTRSADLINLLVKANQTGAKLEAEQFKRQWFDKQGKFYTCRHQLAFQPAEPEAHHGIPDLEEQLEFALGASYRLGCKYIRDFHYDVYRRDAKHLAAQFVFTCRRDGEFRPKDDHLNITVDDRKIG